jgi:cation transport protein ChaC
MTLEDYMSNTTEYKVFVYGALMWSLPEGVVVEDKRKAKLHGYSRSFCVFSRNYRGTAELPGLVLGLCQHCEDNTVATEDTGRSHDAYCEGLLLSLGSCKTSLELIDGQEMIPSSNPIPVYNRHLVSCRVSEGDELVTDVLIFVANPSASAPVMSEEERARVIASRRGARGENQEYLEMTGSMLEEMGIHDPGLMRLRERVREIKAGEGGGRDHR